MEILAKIVGRVLRGEPVSTIPAERPSRFHLAVNLRTARALGITVPPAILLRANEVFE
jgi:putative ABC transport system substrate-binding protein